MPRQIRQYVEKRKASPPPTEQEKQETPQPQVEEPKVEKRVESKEPQQKPVGRSLQPVYVAKNQKETTSQEPERRVTNRRYERVFEPKKKTTPETSATPQVESKKNNKENSTPAEITYTAGPKPTPVSQIEQNVKSYTSENMNEFFQNQKLQQQTNNNNNQ